MLGIFAQYSVASQVVIARQSVDQLDASQAYVDHVNSEGYVFAELSAEADPAAPSATPVAPAAPAPVKPAGKKPTALDLIKAKTANITKKAGEAASKLNKVVQRQVKDIKVAADAASKRTAAQLAADKATLKSVGKKIADKAAAAKDSVKAALEKANKAAKAAKADAAPAPSAPATFIEDAPKADAPKVDVKKADNSTKADAKKDEKKPADAKKDEKKPEAKKDEKKDDKKADAKKADDKKNATKKDDKKNASKKDDKKNDSKKDGKKNDSKDGKKDAKKDDKDAKKDGKDAKKDDKDVKTKPIKVGATECPTSPKEANEACVMREKARLDKKHREARVAATKLIDAQVQVLTKESVAVTDEGFRVKRKCEEDPTSPDCITSQKAIGKIFNRISDSTTKAIAKIKSQLADSKQAGDKASHLLDNASAAKTVAKAAAAAETKKF